MICPGCYREPCACAQPAGVADLIAETGDHPTSGMFCPGRHRAPWTPARVRADAFALLAEHRGLRPEMRGHHEFGVVRATKLADAWEANALVRDLDGW